VTGSHGAYGGKLLDSFGKCDDGKEDREGDLVVIVKDERRI
jgi:hypothetical protein